MKELDQYEKACEKLKDAFMKSLYPVRKRDFDDAYWIADEIGGCYSWGEWYVSIGTMADYFRYELNPEQFFSWYDDYLDENKRLNMKIWKLTQPLL